MWENATEVPLPTTPPPLPRRGRRRLVLVAGGVAAFAGAGLLFAVDPSASNVYLPCPFHQLTGMFCPGCGSTRATHHLLHGRLGTAFGYNPLLVVALPFLVYGTAKAAQRWVYAEAQPPASRRPGWWVWALLVAVLAFAVARNLPWEPVRWMAP